MSRAERFVTYIKTLQDQICDRFEELDGASTFDEDQWSREEGGGGTTRIIKDGDLFEKGGVNISEVHGDLPEQIQRKFGVSDDKFFAAGISLVMHPLSPMVPTVHANFRYFELYEAEVGGNRSDAWFGGGIDLTPYYLWEEDVIQFHTVLKNACDPHGSELYPRFKEKCDNYFYLDHRNEARGIGGVFFDYLRANDERTLDDWHDFTTSVGDCFLDAYVPIVRRRRDEPYDDQHRHFQEVQRGRYVEFNLVYDRGTLFGLKTGGRTESILMSMPPRVRWEYDFTLEEGSREEELKEVLTSPRDWLDETSPE
jgi:coproporphyrinogen III oxidase